MNQARYFLRTRKGYSNASGPGAENAQHFESKLSERVRPTRTARCREPNVREKIARLIHDVNGAFRSECRHAVQSEDEIGARELLHVLTIS